MLQKVPLHIASTEAKLKEEIRKSAPTPPVASTQPMSTGFTKRKPPKDADKCTLSPSVAKRKRMRIDSSFTPQKQLPSPKSSRDTLPTQGDSLTTNGHRSLGDALHSSFLSASRSINTAQTPNPGQRLSMQPPTPRIISTTPSRRQSIFPLERAAQPTFSLSRKRESTLDPSVTPFLARPVSGARSATPVLSYHRNQSKDAFKLPTQSHIHTPSKHPDDQPASPSVQLSSSVKFPTVRHQFTQKPLSSQAYRVQPIFPSA